MQGKCGDVYKICILRFEYDSIIEPKFPIQDAIKLRSNFYTTGWEIK